MKNTLLYLITISLVLIIDRESGQSQPTGYAPQFSTNELSCVYLIIYHENFGTSFTLDYKGRQYLITARHVVDGIKEFDSIQVFLRGELKTYSVNSIVCSDPSIDITILALNQLLVSYPGVNGLHVTDGHFSLIQDVYYMGFPYGMHGMTNAKLDMYFPIIKRGLLSSIGGLTPSDKIYVIDGFNNEGFSGGPILLYNSEVKEYQVGAVIQSYRYQIDTVYDNLQEYNRLDSLFRVHAIKDKPVMHPTDQYVLSNTGIFFGSSLGYAIKEIVKKPIGFKIPN